jgi:hypothetical protein
MHPIRHIRRIAAALAALVGALLAFAAAPAFASGPGPLPPIRGKHPPLPVDAHTVVAGGMPGWQIARIALGAALVAATVAVLVNRAWAAPQDNRSTRLNHGAPRSPRAAPTGQGRRTLAGGTQQIALGPKERSS